MAYEKDLPVVTTLTSDDQIRILDGTSSKLISRDNFAAQWIDSSGRLRIKATAPSSDTDGTVVGTQS